MGGHQKCNPTRWWHSLVKFPLPVVKGTDLSGLEPAGDAVEVEGVIAHTPGYRTLLTGGRGLVGLALDACTQTHTQ